MRDIIVLLIFLIAFLLFGPKPGIDCSHYHEKTFHGVTVNCDRQAVQP